jgi:hypothetical protein
MEMALLLERKIDTIGQWLHRRGTDIPRRVTVSVGREYDLVEPDMGQQEHVSPTTGKIAQSAAYHEARRRARARWLIRRILTPNTPECLLPAGEVLVLRRQLLAKVRDQARRSGPDALMVRASAKTLEGIDEISYAHEIRTRADAVAYLVKEAIDELKRQQRKRRR